MQSVGRAFLFVEEHTGRMDYRVEMRMAVQQAGAGVAYATVGGQVTADELDVIGRGE
jgi:hypothetical protein